MSLLFSLECNRKVYICTFLFYQVCVKIIKYLCSFIITTVLIHCLFFIVMVPQQKFSGTVFWFVSHILKNFAFFIIFICKVINNKDTSKSFFFQRFFLHISCRFRDFKQYAANYLKIIIVTLLFQYI